MPQQCRLDMLLVFKSVYVCVIMAKCISGDTFGIRNIQRRDSEYFARCLSVHPSVRGQIFADKAIRNYGCIAEIERKAELENRHGMSCEGTQSFGPVRVARVTLTATRCVALIDFD